jgi:hypothetical protein
MEPQRQTEKNMGVTPGRTGRTEIGDGVFEPAERPVQHGARANPAGLITKKTHAGVLLCGLQEGEGKRAKKHKVGSVVKIVQQMRTEQVGSADASFMSQLGLYTHHKSRKVVSEESVRIIIIKVTSPSEESVADFYDHMAEIGEALCSGLGQESVIMERQVNGVVEGTYSVTAE